MDFNIANILINSIPLNEVVVENTQSFDKISLIITIISAIVTLIALSISVLGIKQTNRLKEQVNNAQKAASLSETAATKAETAATEAKEAANSAETAAKETINNSKEIQRISEEIADYTRKPLEGIEQVLAQMYKLVQKHKPFHKFYYLGLTLGIGPVHETTEIIKNWDKDFKAGVDEKSFKEMYEELHRKLKEVVLSEKTCIVCLNRRYVYRDFIEPLYKNKYSDETISKQLHSEIFKRHNIIVEKNNSKADSKKVRYISTIPIQVMGAEIGDDKEAVIVFNVGTTNAGSDKVLGFYSESPSMCKLFREYVEALYEYTPS